MHKEIKSMTSRDLQASERREQILNAARQLFVQEGYHAASMRAINKKVGMSDALTYHYFPEGKLEIFNTIIREGHEQRIQDINNFVKSLKSDLSLRDGLLLVGQKVSEIFLSNDEITQLVIREKNLLEPEQYKFLTNITQQLIDSMIGFLSNEPIKSQIREMDLRLAIMQFIYNFTTISIFGKEFVVDGYDGYIEKIVDFTVKLWSE
ncbi:MULTISPECIES: TetR/AcrR family transcriptional regulator [unclassified Paenibacillus]|uniref:TetR/AcrR family transcriptional regulator n=1 Tax=unclassified Paenibacillus TaxID=185978 RepID=UPI0030FC0EB1